MICNGFESSLGFKVCIREIILQFAVLSDTGSTVQSMPAASCQWAASFLKMSQNCLEGLLTLRQYHPDSETTDHNLDKPPPFKQLQKLVLPVLQKT